mmetsp:Transcript_17676/g.15487  ORF Transcript_17676/g.15487 Transcript_17676/m.15487 type:complete len:84 (-) Transcript_17676:67-318(-)
MSTYQVSEKLKERCVAFLDESLANVEKCSTGVQEKEFESIISRYSKTEETILMTIININRTLEENQNNYLRLKDLMAKSKIET